MGSLEELEDIFDFISLDDPRQASISRDDFLASMLRYNLDKQGFLTTLALQHLGTIRRRVLRVECKVDAGRREQRQMAMLGNPELAKFLEPRVQAEQRAR